MYIIVIALYLIMFYTFKHFLLDKCSDIDILRHILIPTTMPDKRVIIFLQCCVIFCNDFLLHCVFIAMYNNNWQLLLLFFRHMQRHSYSSTVISTNWQCCINGFANSVQSWFIQCISCKMLFFHMICSSSV